MPGGIERVVQDIAEGLNHKTDMEVLTCQVKGRETVEKIRGVKVRRCASLGTTEIRSARGARTPNSI